MPKDKKNSLTRGHIAALWASSLIPISHSLTFARDRLRLVNESKLFAGIVMLMLNIGSRYVSLPFSRPAEEFLRANLSSPLLIFAVAWMGTHDIYTSLCITAVFFFIAQYILNDHSPICLIPNKYRHLARSADANKDGVVTDAELQAAIATLSRANRDKQREQILQFY